MKLFFKKIFFGFCMPSIVLILLIITLIPWPENYYNFSIIDKHRILAGTKSPKLVLAGGSNLAFGIDSEAIGKKLNIPAVNMGVHIGFGLGRILDDIFPFLNKGDFLLVAPEYEQFSSLPTWNGDILVYDLIFGARQYRLLWSFYYDFPAASFSGFLSSRLSFLRKMLTGELQEILPPYTRDSFNEYGDNIAHLEMGSYAFAPGAITVITDGINTNRLNRFFDLVDAFSKRGITVLMSYPGLEKQSFINSAGFIKELDSALRAKENLRVISAPEDFCFPLNYFFDTQYHLSAEGRAARTGQLIEDLEASGLFTTGNLTPRPEPAE